MGIAKATGAEPAQGRRRGRPPAPSRRDQLLDAAARQLNARGLTDSVLADVGAELRISRNALYYYVRDREDLVFQVYGRACNLLARHLEHAAEAGRALDVVRAFAANALSADAPEIAAISEIGFLRPADGEAVRAAYEALIGRLASVLEAGARAGEVRACDFDVAARCIVSLIFWTPLASRWARVAPPPRERLVAALVDFVTRGTDRERDPQAEAPRLPPTAPALGGPAAFDRAALTAAKREMILLAASKLFNAKGIDAVSLEEIARDLGATKRALYHQFPEKQSVVRACYVRAFEIYAAPIRHANALDLPARDAWSAVYRASCVAQLRADLSPLRPLVGYEALSPADRAIVEAQVADYARQGDALTARCVAEAGWRADLDLEVFRLLVTGANLWLAKDPLPSDAAAREALADEATLFVRLGLAPVA